MSFSSDLLFKRAAALVALCSATVVLAAAPTNRIMMLIRSGRSTKTFEVKSVTFDHAAMGGARLRSKTPPTGGVITLVLPSAPVTQAALKPTTKLAKVDLVLYVSDGTKRQRLRSQVEMGSPVVTEYKLSDDKKTATVKLSASLVYISETGLTGNSDWVATN